MTDASNPADLAAQLFKVLTVRPSCLACDLDGTLSRIASIPAQAQVAPAVIRSLATLAQSLGHVVVVSGRPAAQVAAMVGLPGLIYVGNHGLECWDIPGGPTGGPAEPTSVPLAAACVALEVLLRDWSGVSLENKGPCLAVHYRLAADPPEVRRQLLAAIDSLKLSGIVILEGRGVVELRPAGSPTKGTALRDLVEGLRLVSIAYIGDDVSDLDAFAALQDLRKSGTLTLNIAVLNPESLPESPPDADTALDGPEEVAQLLAYLVALFGQSDFAGCSRRACN